MGNICCVSYSEQVKACGRLLARRYEGLNPLPTSLMSLVNLIETERNSITISQPHLVGEMIDLYSALTTIAKYSMTED